MYADGRGIRGLHMLSWAHTLPAHQRIQKRFLFMCCKKAALTSSGAVQR